MSHYCKTCYYNPKIKIAPKACPFNSFYWHFYERHRDKLSKNPRIGMAYRHLNKIDRAQKVELLQQAEDYLNDIENL